MYKKFILSFLFLNLFANPCLATSWKFKKDYGDTQIYISPNKTRLTLNYNKTPLKKKKITKSSLNTLIKEKLQLLKKINIHEWKITNKKIVIKKNYTTIYYSGSYKNVDNKKIFFKEYHFYGNDKKLQILLTNSSSVALTSDATFKNIQKIKTKYQFN